MKISITLVTFCSLPYILPSYLQKLSQVLVTCLCLNCFYTPIGSVLWPGKVRRDGIDYHILSEFRVDELVGYDKLNIFMLIHIIT